jgi:hypothetical protein
MCVNGRRTISISVGWRGSLRTCSVMEPIEDEILMIRGNSDFSSSERQASLSTAVPVTLVAYVCVNNSRSGSLVLNSSSTPALFC